jgi:5-methylcytosine-specific restriction endonuclease McrA
MTTTWSAIENIEVYLSVAGGLGFWQKTISRNMTTEALRTYISNDLPGLRNQDFDILLGARQERLSDKQILQHAKSGTLNGFRLLQNAGQTLAEARAQEPAIASDLYIIAVPPAAASGPQGHTNNTQGQGLGSSASFANTSAPAAATMETDTSVEIAAALANMVRFIKKLTQQRKKQTEQQEMFTKLLQKHGEDIAFLKAQADADSSSATSHESESEAESEEEKAFADAVKAKYGGRGCLLCGDKKNLEAAHITPKEKGPTPGIELYGLENGLLLCEQCHLLFDNHLWYVEHDGTAALSRALYYNYPDYRQFQGTNLGTSGIASNLALDVQKKNATTIDRKG